MTTAVVETHRVISFIQRPQPEMEPVVGIQRLSTQRRKQKCVSHLDLSHPVSVPVNRLLSDAQEVLYVVLY